MTAPTSRWRPRGAPHRRASLVLSRLLPLATAFSLTGCALTFDAQYLGVPATMAAPAGTSVTGDSFRVTRAATHLFFGLYAVRQPSLQQVLAGQLVGGRGVANLRISVRRRWSDLLVTALTLGLVVPTSVTFEGVVTGVTPTP